jgi:hypothetical protein
MEKEYPLYLVAQKWTAGRQAASSVGQKNDHRIHAGWKDGRAKQGTFRLFEYTVL